MATRRDSAKTPIRGTDHRWLPCDGRYADTLLAAAKFMGTEHTWDRAGFGRQLELSRCQAVYVPASQSVWINSRDSSGDTNPALSHLLPAFFGKAWPPFIY